MQVLVPLYFHCSRMPDQAELQQALLDIITQGPADTILGGLQEVFPNAGWTDGELGDCVVDRTQAMFLDGLLRNHSADRFPVDTVPHLKFRGQDVALEDILRRSGARLDHVYRDATGLAPWVFADGSALILQPEGGWYLRAAGCAKHCCGTCSCD
jgi:hypothetical protein